MVGVAGSSAVLLLLPEEVVPSLYKEPRRSCQNLLHLDIEDALVVGDEGKQEGENGHDDCQQELVGEVQISQC